MFYSNQQYLEMSSPISCLFVPAKSEDIINISTILLWRWISKDEKVNYDRVDLIQKNFHNQVPLLWSS